MKQLLKLTAVMTLTVLAACSSGDSDSGEGIAGPTLSAGTSASFEGVYQIVTTTENPDACDEEGEPITGGQAYVVAAGSEVLGQQMLTLATCDDGASCRDIGRNIKAQEGFGAESTMWFSSELGPDQVGGFSAGTGVGNDGVCTERSFEDLTMTREGTAVRVESRVKRLPDQPQEDGFCVVRPAESAKQAEAADCTTLTVWTLERIADSS